jgi:hypothetical protein
MRSATVGGMVCVALAVGVACAKSVMPGLLFDLASPSVAQVAPSRGVTASHVAARPAGEAGTPKASRTR